MRLLSIFPGLFVLASLVFSGVARAEEPGDYNCHIHITITRKSGAVKERHYFTTTPTREACEHAADLHRTNFAPQAIAEKKVEAVWSGK